MKKAKKVNKAAEVRVLLAEGMDAQAIAKKLKVTANYVHQIKWHWKKSGQKVRDNNAKVMAKISEEFDKQYEKFKNKPITVEQLKKDGAAIADMINHPPHYKVGGIETIEFIEAKGLNYNLGNVVKYITRADHKGHREQDLNKALWYLTREIQSFSEV